MCIINEEIISMMEGGHPDEDALRNDIPADTANAPVESDEEVLAHLNQKICL